MRMFKNRKDAALKLLPRLEEYAGSDTIIIAIPRGAVPIAVFLAGKLKTGLELVHVKKIGHPNNPELAIGSVSLSDVFLDDKFGISPELVDSETEKLRAILTRRQRVYGGIIESKSIRNKILILVDDGIATGNTMYAAIQYIRKQHPKKLILAVPVASRSAIRYLTPWVDDVVCLYSPQEFSSVGEFYDDFSAVSDEDAIAALQLLHQE